MVKENVVKQKSFDFALRVVKLFKHLQGKKEFILSKQLLRSGTAVGAMVREAEFAESKDDFVHKMAIAQKEINETIYWLELLNAAEYLTTREFESISPDATEILKLITASIKTAKGK